jgi:hypothetical protein
MAQLAISDELFDRVLEIARARRLPIEQQVEEMLAEAIDRRSRPSDLRATFDRVAALTPRKVTQTDAVELLREDRDR